MSVLILSECFSRRKHCGRGLVSLITKQASRACPRIDRSSFPECGLHPSSPPLEGKPQARRIFRSRFSHRSFRNSTPTPPVPVLAPVSHRLDRYASDPPFSLSPRFAILALNVHSPQQMAIRAHGWIVHQRMVTRPPRAPYQSQGDKFASSHIIEEKENPS
jgi:hypothetical protein